jgi:hypothetical protein
MMMMMMMILTIGIITIIKIIHTTTIENRDSKRKASKEHEKTTNHIHLGADNFQKTVYKTTY